MKVGELNSKLKKAQQTRKNPQSIEQRKAQINK